MTPVQGDTSYWKGIEQARDAHQLAQAVMAGDEWWRRRHPRTGAPGWFEALHQGNPRFLVAVSKGLQKLPAHEAQTARQAEDNQGFTLGAALLRTPQWRPPQGEPPWRRTAPCPEWQQHVQSFARCNRRGEGLVMQLMRAGNWGHPAHWPDEWERPAKLATCPEDWLGFSFEAQQALGEALFEGPLLFLGSGGRSAALNSWLQPWWGQPWTDTLPGILQSALAVLEWVHVVQSPGASMTRLDALMTKIHHAPMAWWEQDSCILEQALLERQSWLKAQLPKEHARAMHHHLMLQCDEGRSDTRRLRRL